MCGEEKKYNLLTHHLINMFLRSYISLITNITTTNMTSVERSPINSIINHPYDYKAIQKLSEKDRKYLLEVLSNKEFEDGGTLLFLDLETNSLNPQTGCVVELCMVALDAQSFYKKDKRVHHTISLCFGLGDSIISEWVSFINGLKKCNLANLKPFGEKEANIIYEYLKRLPEPLYFVAHCGKRFDIPFLLNTVNTLHTTDQCCNLYNFLFDPQKNKNIFLIDSHEVFETYYRCRYGSEELKDLKLHQDEMYRKRLKLTEAEFKQMVQRQVEEAGIKNYKNVPPLTVIDIIDAHANDGFVEQRRIEPSGGRNYQKIPKTISKKLIDIYERELGRPLIDNHSALNDVNALIEIAMANTKMFCGVGNFRKHKFKELIPNCKE